MTEESFRKLKRGDIVQNLGTGNSYIVNDSIGGKVVLTTILIATHPDEWKLIQEEECRKLYFN